MKCAKVVSGLLRLELAGVSGEKVKFATCAKTAPGKAAVTIEI